jgi:hypothetical protein
MLVFYIPPCRQTFREFSGDLVCEKKKKCEKGGIRLASLGVLNLSYTPRPWVTLHESTKYKILSPPLTFLAWRNVKYKHRRGSKCYGIKRGLFHFPKESLILISFCYSGPLVDKGNTRINLCFSINY